MSQAPRVLILRFSSFGDVLQSLSIIGKVKESWPDAEVHFCTRKEFAPLVVNHKDLSQLWVLDRSNGTQGIMELAKQLKQVEFTHIYDCHNNLRSRILSFCLNGFLGWRRFVKGHHFLRRPIFRFKRFLLFKFHYNSFPKPFSGQGALLQPLKKWGINEELPKIPQLFFDEKSEQLVIEKYGIDLTKKIALAPSAAHPLKRWPLNHFKELITSMPSQEFVVLGGPEDSFTEELVAIAPERVINFAGKLSLMESCIVVSLCRALVSNDTGLMHVAEQTGVPCVALMGPAPFGFPSRPLTHILQRDLPCRPCSKHGQGPCVNKIHQKCLVDILPEEVQSELDNMGVLV